MIYSLKLSSNWFLLALNVILIGAHQGNDVPSCSLDGYNVRNLTEPEFWGLTLTSNASCLPNASVPCIIRFAFCKSLDVPPEGNVSSDACHEVAGCQLSRNGSETFSMGQYENNPFKASAANSFEASFRNGSSLGTCNVSTSFTFVCNKSQPWSSGSSATMPEPVNVSYTASNCSYRFVFGYAGACLDPKPSEDNHLSTGSVLLIMFAVAVFVYIAVGMAINYRSRPESEHWFPHYTFWSELPGYIADGWIFFCSVVTCRYSVMYRTYDTI